MISKITFELDTCQHKSTKLRTFMEEEEDMARKNIEHDKLKKQAAIKDSWIKQRRINLFGSIKG